MKSAATRRAPVPPGVCDVAARPDFSDFVPFAEHQLLHGRGVRPRAVDRQVRHRLLPLQHELAGPLNRFEDRRLAGAVLIDADAQVDLLRIRIVAERLGETEDRIAWCCFDCSNIDCYPGEYRALK